MNTVVGTVCGNQDELRLICLSRIPRCAQCPRLDALQLAHDVGSALVAPIPDVPESCRHQVCASLITHFHRHEQLSGGNGTGR